MNDLIASFGHDISMLVFIILLSFWIGHRTVSGFISQRELSLARDHMERQREDWKDLYFSSHMPKPPPGLPPGGSPNLALLAAQLQQTYKEPVHVALEKDRAVLNHYAGLICSNTQKHGLISYDCIAPTTIVGPVSGKVRHMKPGDQLTTNVPLFGSITEMPLDLFRSEEHTSELQAPSNNVC